MINTNPTPFGNSDTIYNTDGEVPTEQTKSDYLHGSIYVVQEVAASLKELKELLGSNDRPTQVTSQGVHEMNSDRLVSVISELRPNIETVCAEMLYMIQELKEDLV